MAKSVRVSPGCHDIVPGRLPPSADLAHHVTSPTPSAPSLVVQIPLIRGVNEVSQPEDQDHPHRRQPEDPGTKRLGSAALPQRRHQAGGLRGVGERTSN